MVLNKAIFSYSNYNAIYSEMEIWLHNIEEKKRMNKGVANTFVPKYVQKNLKWYERDGLMT